MLRIVYQMPLGIKQRVAPSSRQHILCDSLVASRQPSRLCLATYNAHICISLFMNEYTYPYYQQQYFQTFRPLK